MKHVDMEKLEMLDSIKTPRKQDSIHPSKKFKKGNRIAPPGSTLPSVQSQQLKRNTFTIPSIKSTQSKRVNEMNYAHSNRIKRASTNKYLDLASERQRSNDRHSFEDDDGVWTFNSTKLADTQSNRKKRYGTHSIHEDRRKSDGFLMDRHRPVKQSHEWDDRRNYSLEKDEAIEIDVNSDEEQDGNDQELITTQSPSISQGQEQKKKTTKTMMMMDEKDDEVKKTSSEEKVKSIPRNKPKKCDSIYYAADVEDSVDHTLFKDSEDETSRNEEQSCFATREMNERLFGNKSVKSVTDVVQSLRDRKNSRSYGEKLSKNSPKENHIWSMRKVNNHPISSILPKRNRLSNRESIESVDSDEQFAMIGKSKEASDDEYKPNNVSNSSKKKKRLGEKAIQRVRAETSKFIRKGLDVLDEWASPARVTRSSSSSKKRKHQANEEVIVLSSDDESLVDDSSLCDESEVGSPSHKLRSSSRKVRFGDRPRIIAQRLAIGSKVFKNVFFSFSQVGKTDMFIEYHKSNGEHIRHKFGCQQVRHAFCYIPDRNVLLSGSSTEDEASDSNKKNTVSEEPKHELAYLIFRAPSNRSTGFDTFSNSYLDDAAFEELEKKGNSATAKENEKRFIALEFAYTEEFIEFYNRFQAVLVMNKDDFFAALLHTGELKSHQKDDYILPLLKSTRVLRNATRDDDDSMNNIKDDEVMLVFPFNASKDEFDSAADGMNEARHSGDSNVSASPHEIVKGKTHMVTIRGEDYKRLAPMEFLNDTLIDFWMDWITRMEPGPSQSNIHIFTTQFFSALEDNGVDAVTKWTARKDIDIFEKKFILIPINKDLHWSLCIVVNPGKIPNGDKILPNMNHFEESEDLDAPFLLLMDSLRTHNKGRIQSHIHDWLNSEAKRLGRFENLKTEAGIFNKRTMPMFDPPVPRQDNSWDCGVFVCRYGYAIYRLFLEGIEFKIKAGTQKKDYQAQLNELISSHQAFKFNMEDIERIRVEMKQLLKNLNVLYTKWRKKEKISKKKKLNEMETKASEAYASKANSIEEQQI